MMNRYIILISTVVFATFLLLTGYTNSHSHQLKVDETFTPILVSVYEDTAPVLGSDNSYHLIYGLMLTNAGRLDAELEKVEIFNADNLTSPIKTLEGEDLVFFLRHLNAEKSESGEIEKDGSRLLFVSLDFEDKGSIPKKMTHRFTLNGAAGPGSKEVSTLAYEAGSFEVSTVEPPVISPPLKGSGWIVINGCCSFMGVHQTSLLPMNGTLYNAQRFALDTMKLDNQEKLVEGDPSVPSNWIGYNEEVYAVADGTVVSVLDGLDDQPPGTLPDPNTITTENYTGNHVVLKIRDGVYVFYAHLRNGGIMVQEGDRVAKGDLIAHLGNSGNTSAPHLHLHLMSTPSPVGSKPVPFVFDTFKLVEKIPNEQFYEVDTLDGTFGDRSKFNPETRHNQLPLDLNVIDYE